MSAVADATGLPVETVAVPEGAARGAAYFARMAAGTRDLARRLSQLGRGRQPDRARPVWARATAERYERFCELGTGVH